MKDRYLATYCYGPLNLSVEEMVVKAKEFGFQGVEFLTPLGPAHKRALEAHGMKVIDTMENPDAEGNLPNMDLLHDLGVKYVSGTNLVSFGNRQQALWVAERLNKAGRALKREGFKLYYHNHTHGGGSVYGAAAGRRRQLSLGAASRNARCHAENQSSQRCHEGLHHGLSDAYGSC